MLWGIAAQAFFFLVEEMKKTQKELVGTEKRRKRVMKWSISSAY